LGIRNWERAKAIPIGDIPLTIKASHNRKVCPHSLIYFVQSQGDQYAAGEGDHMTAKAGGAGHPAQI